MIISFIGVDKVHFIAPVTFDVYLALWAYWWISSVWTYVHIYILTLYRHEYNMYNYIEGHAENEYYFYYEYE